MDLINYSILLSAIINFLFGIIIFLKGKNKKVNVVFSLFAFSVVLWSISMIIYRVAVSVEYSVLLCRLLYIPPICIMVFLIYFAYLFCDLKAFTINKKIWLFAGGSIMIGLILFTDLVIKGVVIPSQGEKIIQFGILYYFGYTIFISGYCLWLYWILLDKYRNSTGIIHSQISYIFIGILLGSLSGMYGNLLLPTFGRFYLNWFGQISSLVMVLLTFYAIIRHRFMDIRFVFRKYSVYSASLISIILPAIVLKYLANKIFSFTDIWLDFIILVISISVFPALKSYYYRIANKYFFSSLYDDREVLAGLSEKLKSTLELDRIYRYISDSLVDAFHVRTLSIFIFDEKSKEYAVKYEVGNELERLKRFVEQKGFYSRVILKNPVIITEEFQSEKYREFRKTIELFAKNQIEVVVPLNVKDKVIGLMALGRKESGDMYNDEDIEVLEIIGAQAAIAIENALLFEETRQFNIKLEGEVKKATKDLRVANIQLKKLDAAKSEFVSIASHQLRTPLTVIKGYISMMLEGNFGAIDLRKRDSLEKVYQSNERLIRLVENLLNISRIESGRLQFTFREMRLEEIVDSVVAELEGNAKKKGLKLEYAPPAKPLLKLKIDEEKIRQVVMNLVDNAVKYTKKGKVMVSVGEDKAGIKFSVRDSGAGIAPDDIARLFKKFSRGAGVSTLNTEGTGLGLYVAKEMVEAHQGRIWAESDGEGKGSRFYFTLPVKTD